MNSEKKTAPHHTARLSKAVFVGLFTLATYLLFSASAHATTPMGEVLCDVIDFIVWGNLGRGLATLGIVTLGVGALLGKASWGLALTVGIGISVMFGAPEIVLALGLPGACGG